jgi:hypothetical protein
MKNILILFGFLILCSCRGKLIFLLYGVDSTPNPKSTAHIQNYIEKEHFPKSNQYLIDAGALSAIRKLDKVISRYILFDKDGNLLIDTFQNSCTGNSDLSIENVIKNKLYIVDSTRKLSMITNHVIDDKGEKRTVIINESAEYFVVLTWATWAGRLNKQGYLLWYNQASSIKEKYKIDILNVNVDLLKVVNYN